MCGLLESRDIDEYGPSKACGQRKLLGRPYIAE